jgi:hypothetical protein
MLSGRRWGFTKATAVKKKIPLILNNYREAYSKKAGVQLVQELQKRRRALFNAVILIEHLLPREQAIV